MKSKHKCRVFKDRWNGRWHVKCYHSDRYIDSSYNYNVAIRAAIEHYTEIYVTFEDF